MEAGGVIKPGSAALVNNLIQGGKTIQQALTPNLFTGKAKSISTNIVSDLLEGNNVYLTGKAGTGKTFMAEKIAKDIMGQPNYTVNCSQWTSPIEIRGGQTIRGYEEGLLIKAWANGGILILDELPKLDPNTAGVLNDMLAKIKRGGDITNGRQEKISKGKAIYIVATGNILLNREDPSYGGNNKQDLSLQDRFAGSCYEFIIELKSERSSMMGYLFIWNYLTKLRFEIMEKRFDNFAFVSRRLMESLRDTHAFYMAQKKSIPTADQKKFQAKTIIQGLESFFDLFLDTQKQALKADTNYDAFKISAVQAMNRPDGQEFVDTTQEIEESDRLVALYMTQQLAKYAYLKPMG
jgi:cobaltochelatase CobS